MTAEVAKASKSPSRGSKPGERRGGRQKGTPNKATASIKDIARLYTDKAVGALVGVLDDDAAPHAAKVGAAKEILDRGYGKASTVINGDEDGGPLQMVTEIVLKGVRPE